MGFSFYKTDQQKIPLPMGMAPIGLLLDMGSRTPEKPIF